MTRREFSRVLAAGTAGTAGVKIESDPARRVFTIDNGAIREQLRVGPSGGLRLEFFGESGGRNLAARNSQNGAGMYARTGGTFHFGLEDTGRFEFIRHATEGNELRLHFRDRQPLLEYVLHTRAFPGLAVIEKWVEIHNGAESPVTVERFDPLFLRLAAADEDTCWLHWVQGCQDYGLGRGMGTNVQPFGPYRVRRERLNCDDSRVLLNTAPFYGNARRSTSSSENLNWFSVETSGGNVFGGLEWSGEWSLAFARTGNELVVHGGVHYFSRKLAPDSTLVSPRAFVGLYRGSVDNGVHQLHRYLRAHVMPPAPDANFPWTCYNTWYNFNINYDEQMLKREAERAAALGIECFYIDAGWWEGSDRSGSFGKGLGAWVENREKFSSGLASFAGFIHGLGMKFGLWAEPERIDRALLDKGPDPIRERWLATRDSFPLARADKTQQLCLGCPDAVVWVKRKLAYFLAEYKCDWLKWDHNWYLPCNREDHGHQPNDGGYAHTTGVYDVLAHLRERFPKLVLESCAGGGNRMDFGMLRYAHTNWNSDDTSPSFRVRYQTTGCSYPFPAQYQNSWFIQKKGVEAVGADSPAHYLDYLFRSRMIGAFGISDRLEEWAPNVRDAARRAMADYKRMRPVLTGGDVHHLFPQPLLWAPPLAPPRQWEAIEYFHPGLQRGVVLVFRADGPELERKLPVRGLEPERRYVLISANTGQKIVRSGREWAERGIAVRLPERASSEIFWIEG